uniref:RING-type E3 ubiquitin transferase n=1 Tax=Kalanchoe fedtschenkoi TaxID=63787 RepID=A0A7N0ZSY4_KALFE
MGAVCCCMHAEDFEGCVNFDSSLCRNCSCLHCFVQNVICVYTSLFRRRQGHPVPSSDQGIASLTSSASFDSTISDTFRSPPRPLPYDADLRHSRLRRDGASRHEKGTSHSQEESEPLRRSNVVLESDTVHNGDKWEKSKVDYSKTSAKVSLETTYDWHTYSSPDDEDVCPTCLEEYTTENPKILTKCSHHFHLGCIYEWMERSETCPVCGKVMVFGETT